MSIQSLIKSLPKPKASGFQNPQVGITRLPNAGKDIVANHIEKFPVLAMQAVPNPKIYTPAFDFMKGAVPGPALAGIVSKAGARKKVDEAVRNDIRNKIVNNSYFAALSITRPRTDALLESITKRTLAPNTPLGVKSQGELPKDTRLIGKSTLDRTASTVAVVAAITRPTSYNANIPQTDAPENYDAIVVSKDVYQDVIMRPTSGVKLTPQIEKANTDAKHYVWIGVGVLVIGGLFFMHRGA